VDVSIESRCLRSTFPIAAEWVIATPHTGYVADDLTDLYQAPYRTLFRGWQSAAEPIRDSKAVSAWRRKAIAGKLE
jgi:hypothetical protein